MLNKDQKRRDVRVGLHSHISRNLGNYGSRVRIGNLYHQSCQLSHQGFLHFTKLRLGLRVSRLRVSSYYLKTGGIISPPLVVRYT